MSDLTDSAPAPDGVASAGTFDSDTPDVPETPESLRLPWTPGPELPYKPSVVMDRRVGAQVLSQKKFTPSLNRGRKVVVRVIVSVSLIAALGGGVYLAARYSQREDRKEQEAAREQQAKDDAAARGEVLPEDQTPAGAWSVVTPASAAFSIELVRPERDTQQVSTAAGPAQVEFLVSELGPTYGIGAIDVQYPAAVDMSKISLRELTEVIAKSLSADIERYDDFVDGFVRGGEFSGLLDEDQAPLTVIRGRVVRLPSGFALLFAISDAEHLAARDLAYDHMVTSLSFGG